MQGEYQVAVVGGGPGGYVAAIRAAQLGLRTVCIDARADAAGNPALGGTCLNVGCIPSKALLDSSAHFAHARDGFAAHGITLGDARMDIGKMQARKDGIVQKLTGGVAQLLAANKIEFVHARAQVQAANQIRINHIGDGGGGGGTITAAHIILAPGSTPVELPIAKLNAKVVDSTGALAFTETPKRLGIIGAGVIGLELGSVWRRLGAAVVLVEAADEFLPTADRQIARAAMREFTTQGLDIRLGAKVTAVETAGDEVKLHYQKDGAQSLSVDKVVVAVGRRAATDELVSGDCGVRMDAAGRIEVDELNRTAVANIWAVGDAVRGPMLAHKSSAEGAAVAERIAGVYAAAMDFNSVPWVIYTAPEIAWVGQTEAELKAANIPHRTGAFRFAANARAMAMQATAGMVKLIAHAKTDRLLGAHIIGAHASELINECAMAMAMHASAEDVTLTLHAHPTLGEAVAEAAMAVRGRALHQAK